MTALSVFHNQKCSTDFSAVLFLSVKQIAILAGRPYILCRKRQERQSSRYRFVNFILQLIALVNNGIPGCLSNDTVDV